jgi:hypothetical protein
MSTDTLDKDAEIKRLREELAEANAKAKSREKALVSTLNIMYEQQEKQKAGPPPDNRSRACMVAEKGSDKNVSPRLQADTDLAALKHQLDIAKLVLRETRVAHDQTKTMLVYYVNNSRLLSRRLAEAREELVIAQQQLALDKCALELAGL